MQLVSSGPPKFVRLVKKYVYIQFEYVTKKEYYVKQVLFFLSLESQIYLNLAGKAMVIRRYVGHDGTLVRHGGIAQVYLVI